MAAEAPIRIRPGVYDNVMGICLVIDDQNGQWTVEKQPDNSITINIPAQAKWKAQRTGEWGKEKLLIFREDGTFNSLSLENLTWSTVAGQHDPATDKMPECLVVYTHPA